MFIKRINYLQNNNRLIVELYKTIDVNNDNLIKWFKCWLSLLESMGFWSVYIVGCNKTSCNPTCIKLYVNNNDLIY